MGAGVRIPQEVKYPTWGDATQAERCGKVAEMQNEELKMSWG